MANVTQDGRETYLDVTCEKDLDIYVALETDTTSIEIVSDIDYFFQQVAEAKVEYDRLKTEGPTGAESKEAQHERP